jgi:1-aminocyclopropane-1-carboxylate deaminase/D-cysteine desulfhydrase-like pyridoxal-dependent ACC family enzyme
VSSLEPLLSAYPRLRERLRSVDLCQVPTPLEALPGLGEHAYVKRDDRTGAEYGGNKLRKLELIAGELVRREARHVITFGGTGTNAGVATAFVCRRLGIACTVLTFDQPHTGVVEQNQRSMRHYGAQVVHVGSLWRTALAWYAHPARMARDSYFLYAGCSNPVATFGHVNAAFELRAQVAQQQAPMPTEIVVAAGTASTLAGLTLGCALAGLPTRVVGVRVAPERVGPFDACTAAAVARQIRAARALLERAHPETARVEVPPTILLGDWYGAGYGVATPATNAAVESARQVGLQLESTYTGKAFAAFLERLAAARGPVLFWNTFSSAPAP